MEVFSPEEQAARNLALNLQALALHRPELHAGLQPSAAGVGDLVRDEHGLFNLRYHRQPKGKELWAYAPSVSHWLTAHLDTVPVDSRALVVIMGVGLGYAALTTLNQRPRLGKIVIVEPSSAMFLKAMEANDLTLLIQSSRVDFVVGDFDEQFFEQSVGRLASLEDTHILRHVASFEWDKPLYEEVNHQCYMLLNRLNAAGGTNNKCGPVFFRNRYQNLKNIRHCNRLDALKGIFTGIPAVLVAAGPSLHFSLSELHNVAGKCLIIAADSALAPLLEAGIMPDIVTTLDFLDLNFEKIAPFINSTWSFSMVAMIKAATLVPARFSSKHLFLAVQDELPNRRIIEMLGIKTLAPSSFSVAHLSLGVAQITGARPIFFLGQDLAYMNDTGDHASGTILSWQGPPSSREILMVRGVDGGSVRTDRHFLSLLRLFEEIIRENPGEYYNLTSAGADIKGSKPITFSRAADYFSRAVDAEMILDKAIRENGAFAVEGLSADLEENIREGERVDALLAESIQLGQRLKKHLKEPLITKLKGLGDLPAKVRNILYRFDELNCRADAEPEIWTPLLELTFASLGENDRETLDNEMTKQTNGYGAWLAAEVERIGKVNEKRRAVLQEYTGQIRQLSTWLAEEARLSVITAASDCSAAQRLELISFYLGHGLVRVAARRMVEFFPDEKEWDDALRYYAGRIRAEQLDFAGADMAWRPIVSGEFREKVTEFRERAALFWIGFAERYGQPEEDGDNFPRLLPVWFERAFTLCRDRTWDTAMWIWEKHFEYLRTKMLQGDTANVARLCALWAPLRNKFPGVWIWQAMFEEGHGGKNAAAQVKEVLARCPGDVTVRSSAAMYLIDAGVVESGVAMLREVVGVRPGLAFLWEELGDRLVSVADYQGALIAYEKCFLSLPGRLDALRKMGDCYLSVKQPEAAIAAYEAALQADPSDEVARRRLQEIKSAQEVRN